MVFVRPESRDNAPSESSQDASIRVKAPKRILHFSDGILEEYSSDEEEVEVPKQAVVDPATLTWGPWVWYKAWSAGSSTLSVVDTVGEFLASVFGITTPRYYFELEEYKRREGQKLQSAEEEKGWSQPSQASLSIPLKEINSSQPRPVDV